jgi:cytochrome c-type biogenesis protein CcmH
MKRVMVFAFALLLSGGAHASASPEDVANEISQEIMSPYCPGVTLHDCPSGAANDLRVKIADWSEDGWSKERILNHLEEQFGDSVSATPPSSGAGLIAWLLPALAVLIGGAAVTYVVMIWSKRKEVPVTEPISGDDRARLDAELKTLEQET